MTHLASGYRSRVNHIVTADGSATLCGRLLTGMAVWPIKLTPRTSHRPTCDDCRTAARAARTARTA